MRDLDIAYPLFSREDERRWEEACAMITVAGPIPMRLSVRRGSIEVEMSTRDRVTGEPVKVYMSSPLPFQWLDDAFAVQILWQAVRCAFLHEAAEFFLVAGVRVLDPHAHGEPR